MGITPKEHCICLAIFQPVGDPVWRSRLLTGVAAGRELSEGQIFHQATGVSIFQASLDIQCKQVRFCQRLGPQGGCQLVNSRIANRAAELETRSAGR